jgi:hypothetical protein
MEPVRKGHDVGMDRAPEPPAALERLRRSVRVTLRARRWLTRWRATSPTPWGETESTTMTANAVELATLTEFVALERDRKSSDHS